MTRRISNQTESDKMRTRHSANPQPVGFTSALHSGSHGQEVASCSARLTDSEHVGAPTKSLKDFVWLTSRLPVLPGVRGLRDAFGRSKEEQDAIGAALLERAFAHLAAHGWAPPTAEAKEALSLGDALWEAHDVRRSPIDIEYAKRLLDRLVEGFWQKWECHPLRTQLDVMRLLQAAIALGGVEPPKMPAKFGPKRRGGWSVSHGRVH